MATAYPGALDATNNQLRTDISSTDDLDATGKEHDVMHVNAHGAIVAVEKKLGTGDFDAVNGAVPPETHCARVTARAEPGGVGGRAVSAPGRERDWNLFQTLFLFCVLVDGGTHQQLALSPHHSHTHINTIT